MVITAHGSAENAVEALKAGAFDYLTKLVDLKQFLQCRGVGHPGNQETWAWQWPRASPASQCRAQQRVLQARAIRPMQRSCCSAGQRIARDAGGEIAHCQSGREYGTGADTRGIGYRQGTGSARRAWLQPPRGKPLVAVNCSAIPENLLESEFFWQPQRRYTGSTHDRQGYFQAAKGGTLFLDEIGDLPLAMQSKLLRAIQERTVRPLGSTQEDTVDVRIVSATHKDLAAGVESGTFLPGFVLPACS